MAAPRDSGLMASLRRLAETLTAIVQTRVELLSVELEEQSLWLWRMLLLAAAVLLFSGLALLCFSAWVVLLFWDSHPAAALAGVTIFYLAAAALALRAFRTRRRPRPRLLEPSLAELARDR
jgi:uncharacterized membrane protein YqjE